MCSGLVRAQSKNLDDLCASIREKVVVPQKPLKIFRDEIYSNDCIFQFSVKKSPNIRVEIERYESEAGAFVELKSQKESFLGRDALEYKDKKSRDRYVNVDPDGFWDTAAAYRNIAVPDHFILLRRKKYLIVILGSEFSVMKETERLLRKVRFY
jgi:hypothetical protein